MADKQRVNLYIPRELVEIIDKYSDKFGCSRGVMISIMLQQYVDQQKVLEMSAMVDMLQAKLAEDGAKK